MIFFLDESGQDRRNSPYEVRAAVAVPNDRLWDLIHRMNRLEEIHFGLNLHSVGVELKGKKCLSKKRIHLSKQCSLMDVDYRRGVVRGMLQRQHIAKIQKTECAPRGAELAAFAQSCSAFILDTLEAAKQCGCFSFAAVLDKEADTRDADGRFLRKDYRILLERFAACVHLATKVDCPPETGILVFDETEKKDSRRMLCQLERYVNETRSGYKLSSCIVPAPFFVQSDLTPVIQISDFLAYIISWGVRFGKLTEPKRDDLGPFAKKARQLEWKGTSEDDLGTQWTEFGYFYLKSLDDGKKRGSDTQSLPAMDDQRRHERRPETAQLQLPLKGVESSPRITNHINVSGFDDWFSAGSD